MSRHVITIVIKDDGTVQGDLDDVVPLWPIGTESTGESTSIDGQVHNIVDQACRRIIEDDLGLRPRTGDPTA